MNMLSSKKAVEQAIGSGKNPTPIPSPRLSGRRVYWAALLLLLMVSFANSNSLNAIWTLDDEPNILQNARLHIQDLQPETLFKTFFSPLHPDKEGRPGLNRPLAHLSLALNWYFGKTSPAGYRLVNIFIHFASAFFLFLVIRELLDTPNMRGRFPGRRDSIALVAAALWALNPIQTQAVVYIVQRMASLACLFYLVAIWCYIQGRASGTCRRRAAFYLLTILSFLAGMGSKENAILLPAALILLEFSFFQDWSQHAVRRRLGYILSAALFIVTLMILGWLSDSGKFDAALGYNIRLFTPWERLLTQPRIAFFYLSQIFYPIPGRLSIVHDVALSRSLLEPWTTLPAILGVLFLIGFGVWQIRRRPMLSFAILFFFLNHAIESSIVGLELIYEHRNYLPSLFLFVPLAIGIQRLIDNYRAQGSAFHRVVAIFTLLLLVGFGFGTYNRNLAWRDPKTFWEDAAHKAPLSMRPLHNLAYAYYEKRGEYDKAFELYQKAIALQAYNRQELSSLHVNLANYHFRHGDFSQALVHLNCAGEAFPGFALVPRLKAFVLWKSGNPQAALDILQPLSEGRPDALDDQLFLAEILLQAGRNEEALDHIERALRLSPAAERALLMMGMALRLEGRYAQARGVLERMLALFPGHPQGVLWLIDCLLQTADTEAAAGYARRFLNGLPPSRVEERVLRILAGSPMPESAKTGLLQWLLSQNPASGASGIRGGAGPSRWNPPAPGAGS